MRERRLKVLRTGNSNKFVFQWKYTVTENSCDLDSAIIHIRTCFSFLTNPNFTKIQSNITTRRCPVLTLLYIHI